MTRYMLRDLMIHVQEHLRVAQQIHFTLMGRVHTRSAMCTSTEMATMVGNLSLSPYLAITLLLLHFTTTHSSLMLFGMALIIVMLLLLPLEQSYHIK